MEDRFKHSLTSEQYKGYLMGKTIEHVEELSGTVADNLATMKLIGKFISLYVLECEGSSKGEVLKAPK